MNNGKIIFKPGVWITINCYSGYVSINSKTQCQRDRTWKPECRYASCHVPSLNNGFYTDTNNSNRISTDQPFGTTIQPVCSWTDYAPSPHTARTCQESGTWSGSDPTCIPQITCSSLPLIDNGHYSAGSLNSPYLLNQEIALICDDGYYLFGSWENRKCTSKDTWNEINHMCLRISCTAPNMIEHGSYNGSQLSYDYGSIVVLTCDRGYFLSNVADTTRKCEGKNLWSGRDPQCQRITCSRPISFNNGRYNDTHLSYDYGSVLTPICIKGFNI